MEVEKNQIPFSTGDTKIFVFSVHKHKRVAGLLFLEQSFSGLLPFSKEFVSATEESVKSASASSSLYRLQIIVFIKYIVSFLTKQIFQYLLQEFQ